MTAPTPMCMARAADSLIIAWPGCDESARRPATMIGRDCGGLSRMAQGSTWLCGRPRTYGTARISEPRWLQATDGSAATRRITAGLAAETEPWVTPA